MDKDLKKMSTTKKIFCTRHWDLSLKHLKSILISPCHRGSACSGRWILWTEQALMGSRTLLMAPEKHPTRAKIGTHSARWTCWCLVRIHVYLFMSVTSFAFLVIFRVPHIKKIAHQLNRVFIFLLFRYLLILGSLSPAIMMPRCLFPPYEYCWMTIIECLQWSSWYSSISHYIWSRLHRTPLAEKFRQVFFDGLPKTRLSKRKILWSARTHLVDLAGPGL